MSDPRPDRREDEPSYTVRAKGATRIADVPPGRLKDLSEARAEATTLAEWLAADTATLVRSILPDVGLAAAAARLLEDGRLSHAGVKGKLELIGHVLGEELQGAGGSSPIVQRLLNHPSNYVREWLAFAIAGQEGLPLAERVRRIRPLAADPNTNVREAAWLALRPHLADDIRRTITLLAGWPHDADARIRRFAIEGTRPRGVWSAHIPQLKTEPELALSLLEPVRADPSDYVRRATAKWLNDASKSRPDWVAGVCDRWLSESPTDETAWICNHALRTLRNDRRRPRNANTTATASALASGRSGA